jgi:AraC-like DNA-binding protein
VAELWEGSGLPVAPKLRLLRERFPSVPIVAYIDLTPTHVRELVSAVRAGVSTVVFRGLENSDSMLCAALLSAQNCETSELILRAIEARVPRRARATVQACAVNGKHAFSVDQLGRCRGITRRGLAKALRSSGLPAPKRLIGWMRLLHAGRLADDPGRSVEAIALELGFASGAALHNMLRR